MPDLVQFFERLKAEGFTGELRMHLSRGRVDSMEMTHYIPQNDYDQPSQTGENAVIHTVEHGGDEGAPTHQNRP